MQRDCSMWSYDTGQHTPLGTPRSLFRNRCKLTIRPRYYFRFLSVPHTPGSRVETFVYPCRVTPGCDPSRLFRGRFLISRSAAVNYRIVRLLFQYISCTCYLIVPIVWRIRSADRILCFYSVSFLKLSLSGILPRYSSILIVS